MLFLRPLVPRSRIGALVGSSAAALLLALAWGLGPGQDAGRRSAAGAADLARPSFERSGSTERGIRPAAWLRVLRSQLAGPAAGGSGTGGTTSSAAARSGVAREAAGPEAGPDEAYTNQDLGAGDERFFDPRDLAVLDAIILANGLGEDSSPRDRNDGDGVLEPLELGFQVWRHGRLRALHSGPDRFSSYGYRIEVLPDAIAELGLLEVLDLHETGLLGLPEAVGDLPALEELRVPGNALEELPLGLRRLATLRTLVLSANRLGGLPEEIGELAALEELHAARNPLGSLPAGLGGLERLRVLDVSALPEREAAASPEAGTGELRELPEELGRLHELEILHVAGNRLFCGSAASGGGSLPAPLADHRRVRVFGLGAQRCGAFGV
jgi:hypothetical protein